MKELNKDWLTDGLIDFEYKKYVLLAYLKDVKENFGEQKLYPYLGDLVLHYQNLISLKENKKIINSQFPKVITKADFEKLQMSYKMIVDDDDIMKEIEDILSFSIPQLESALVEGKDIYEYVEKNVSIEPIGLSPLYSQEGYVFIDEDHKNDMEIYKYQVTVFENVNEKYRGVNMELIETVKKSLGTTFERVKKDLIDKNKSLPNPATYAILTKFKFPYKETLLPVAKRLFVKFLNTSTT